MAPTKTIPAPVATSATAIDSAPPPPSNEDLNDSVEEAPEIASPDIIVPIKSERNYSVTPPRRTSAVQPLPENKHGTAFTPFLWTLDLCLRFHDFQFRSLLLIVISLVSSVNGWQPGRDRGERRGGRRRKGERTATASCRPIPIRRCAKVNRL